MHFSGEIHVPAPRESVFDRLRDAQFFASCVQGVGALTENATNQYSARLTTRIAYIRFDFDINVQIVRAERPHVIEARIDGKPHGVVGRLSATSSANFAGGGNGTKALYQIEPNPISSLGRVGAQV